MTDFYSDWNFIYYNKKKQGKGKKSIKGLPLYWIHMQSNRNTGNRGGNKGRMNDIYKCLIP